MRISFGLKYTFPIPIRKFMKREAFIATGITGISAQVTVEQTGFLLRTRDVSGLNLGQETNNSKECYFLISLSQQANISVYFAWRYRPLWYRASLFRVHIRSFGTNSRTQSQSAQNTYIYTRHTNTEPCSHLDASSRSQWWKYPHLRLTGDNVRLNVEIISQITSLALPLNSPVTALPIIRYCTISAIQSVAGYILS